MEHQIDRIQGVEFKTRQSISDKINKELTILNHKKRSLSATISTLDKELEENPMLTEAEANVMKALLRRHEVKWAEICGEYQGIHRIREFIWDEFNKGDK